MPDSDTNSQFPKRWPFYQSLFFCLKPKKYVRANLVYIVSLLRLNERVKILQFTKITIQRLWPMILLTSGFIQLNSVSIVYIKFIEGNNLKKKKIFKSYLTLVSKFKRSWIFFKDFCGLLRLYAVFIHRKYPKGPFKYYVIKEVGGWGQKMAILDDIQYCKSSKSWVGGPKKGKNVMT